MRTLLTFTALMLMSTAALAADRYCANQGTPDEMVMTEDGDLHIKSATGTETLTWAMSVGAGFNGRIYTNARGDTEVVNDTTIEMVSGPKTTIEKQIYLFRDRVFWPCDEPRYENTAAN